MIQTLDSMISSQIEMWAALKNIDETMDLNQTFSSGSCEGKNAQPCAEVTVDG